MTTSISTIATSPVAGLTTTQVSSMTTDALAAVQVNGVAALQAYTFTDGSYSVIKGTGQAENCWLPLEPNDPRVVDYQALVSLENLTASATTAVQNMLDTLAQSWQYKNIDTAASYAGDPNVQFNAEGTALKTWRSAVWAQVSVIQAEPAASQPSSIEALLALLPAAPARPVAS